MGSNTFPMGWAQPALPAALVAAGTGPEPGPGLVMVTGIAGMAWGEDQAATSPCPACALSSPAPSPLPSRDPAPGTSWLVPLSASSSLMQQTPARIVVATSWLISTRLVTLHKVPLSSPFLLLLPFHLAGNSSRVFSVALLGLTPGAAEEPLAAA